MAFALDPGNSIANYNVGCCYAAIGKPDLALRHLRQVFDGPPSSWRTFRMDAPRQLDRSAAQPSGIQDAAARLASATAAALHAPRWLARLPTT